MGKAIATADNSPTHHRKTNQAQWFSLRCVCKKCVIFFLILMVMAGFTSKYVITIASVSKNKRK